MARCEMIIFCFLPVHGLMFSSSSEEKEWENIVAFIPPACCRNCLFMKVLALSQVFHRRARLRDPLNIEPRVPQTPCLQEVQKQRVGVPRVSRARGRNEMRRFLLEKIVGITCVMSAARMMWCPYLGTQRKPGVMRKATGFVSLQTGSPNLSAWAE